MPIHVILGKPGSGKSLYATTRVIDELVYGRRNVVTNLPLNVGRLNEYLQQKYPKVDTKFVERLRVMTDEEMRTFWHFRGPGDKENAATGTLCLGEAPNGVAYFLDEAHIAFNARDWATLGRGALHYLSQHRKLGDVVWPITQSPGNLDKQFRSVSEDFTVLRNEYTAKYGIFRGRGRFVRRTYLQEPTPHAEPFETATFTLDVKGVASCYDTARGIGVHGNKADIGRRAKGIPIWVVIPGALLLALSVVFIPWLMGKSAQKYIGGDARKKGVPVDGKPSGGVDGGPAVESAPNPTQPPAVGLPRLNWTAEDTPEKPLWITGLVMGRGQFTLTLSDGRRLTEKDKAFEWVDRRGIEVDGRRVFWKGVNTTHEGSQPLPERTPDLTDRPSEARDVPPDSLNGEPHASLAP